MSEKRRGRQDAAIAAVVIIAGLLTGGLATWYFLSPKPGRSYTPEYPVAEEQRLPYDMLAAQAEAAGEPGAADAAGADEAAPEAEQPEGRRPDDAESAPHEPHPPAADIRVIEGARERQADGDYVKLTEELFVRLSAKMVIFASTLENHPEADNTAKMQGLMTDFAARELAEASVNPDDFYAYSQRIAEDPRLSEEVREKILREAEKHTTRRITVSDVPGVPPTPVAGPEDE